MSTRAAADPLREVWQVVSDLLFPPRCAGCQQPGVIFCAACLDGIALFPEPRCARCDLPLASSDAPLCRACAHREHSALDGLRVVGPHSEPLRGAIHALKYERRAALAAPLGERLAARWRADGTRVDGLVPVPLHPERERERGFNQSERLAEAMSEPLGLPVRTELLHRARATRPQVGLARGERLANVAAAFLATPGVAGGRWLLVDDVCTTSATLEACAEALRAQGASAVWAITLARPQDPMQELPGGTTSQS